MGRSFTSQEASPNGGNVVIINYGLWKSRFESDPTIVGKAISLNHEAYTVIGVTGRGFQSDPAADLWMPFQFATQSNDPTDDLQVAGRPKPDFTLAQANAELKLAAQEAQRTHSFPDANFDFEVKPIRDMIVGNVRSSLLMLAVAVGLVLLVACANVANLLLARSWSKSGQFAIRPLPGSGRVRIVRQLLTESTVLSLIGGMLGMVIGLYGVRALLAMNPGHLPRIGHNGLSLGVDWLVSIFTTGLSVLTGFLFRLFLLLPHRIWI